MAYSTPPDFTPFDVLTAAELDILSANDISFNDGTGIFGLYKNLLAVDSNPYKFSVYRGTAYSFTTGAETKMPFNAEAYDTNNNFDSTTNFRYTAPVNGFYHFSGGIGGTVSTATTLYTAIFKNGSAAKRGVDLRASAQSSYLACDIQLTAGDYVEFYYYSNSAMTCDTTGYLSFWCGHLISRT